MVSPQNTIAYRSIDLDRIGDSPHRSEGTMRYVGTGLIAAVLFLGACQDASPPTSTSSTKDPVNSQVSGEPRGIVPIPGSGNHPRGPQNSLPNSGTTLNWGGNGILTTPKVVAIYWAQSTIFSGGPAPGTSGTAAQDGSLVGYFLRNLGSSPYWAINSSYGSPSTGNGRVGPITYTGYWADNDPYPFQPGTWTVTKAAVENELRAALTNGFLTWEPNTIYAVFGALGVNLGDAQGLGGCAYHSHTSWGPLPVIYAVQPYNIPGCQIPSPSPNNDPPADAQVNLLAHELEEAATDPIDGWHNGNTENADLCAWIFGTQYTVSGANANMKFAGKHWLIQENYIQSTGHCHLGGATTLSVTPATGTATIGLLNDKAYVSSGCNSTLLACPMVWTSSNPAVATVPASTTVSPAEITGVSAGSATITGCTGREDDQICTTHTTNVYPTFTTTISGPSQVRLGQSCLWTTSESGGGVGPYTYGTWYATAGATGSSETPDVWRGSLPNPPGGSGFDLYLWVWDSRGVASYKTKHITINPSAPNCLN
jgi:hypothetical protein